MWHGYVLLEKTPNLNQTNFDRLCANFGSLTPADENLPAYLMQVRSRLDNGAVLYEAAFDESDIGVSSFVNFMAVLFNVSPGDVESIVLGDVSYSGDGRESRRFGFNYPVGGNERLQVVRFGRESTWKDSRLEASAYIDFYTNDWDGNDA